MINEAYKEIIEPQNIRNQFKSEEEFISWLETGTTEDLKCALKVFEDAEMYEDCVIINNLVKMQGTRSNGTSNTDIN
jgi:hypothetical protein